jgi:DNA polymerase-3 subunit epsilon
MVAKNIARDIEGCDLAGFNSNRFDIPLLAKSSFVPTSIST